MDARYLYYFFEIIKILASLIFKIVIHINFLIISVYGSFSKLNKPMVSLFSTAANLLLLLFTWWNTFLVLTRQLDISSSFFCFLIIWEGLNTFLTKFYAMPQDNELYLICSVDHLKQNIRCFIFQTLKIVYSILEFH